MVDISRADNVYTKKQQEVMRWYCTNDFFMLINHGAIRAGKTIVNNDLFMLEILRVSRGAKVKEPQYILAGASLGAIRRNVLHPLVERYGVKIKFDSANRFMLLGVLVCCFGHDDIGALSSITGMTAYGAYINEGVLANKEVFEQILKRCSADANFTARILVDTNPKDPRHHIKENYIDKSTMGESGTIKSFHWKLDDNTKLSEAYRSNIKAVTPSGVFTSRDILGQWVTPEGAVYLDFDDSVHIIEELPKFARYFAGVDWGYEHFGSICFFGEAENGDTILIKEITARHKLIEWWIQEAKKIIAEYGFGIPFYCDSARPDNIQEFNNSNIWAVAADKSIMAGVEQVAKMFKTKKLKIYKQGICEFTNEIYSYTWGKDGKPLKLNDNVMDAMRYGIYSDFIQNN